MEFSKGCIGCIHLVWHFLVVKPLWLAILVGIMLEVDAPNWVWYVFYAYFPAVIFGAVIAGIVMGLEQADKKPE